MNFKNWSLALVAASLVAPLSASALGISIDSVVTSGGTSYLEHNDTVTINLVLENATQEEVSALGIGVYGYDQGAVGNANDNALRFVSGSSAASAFDTVSVPTTGNFGGLPNSVTTAQESGAPFPFLDERRVLLFNGVQLGATSNGTGAIDIGLGGDQIQNGDIHMSVTFQAIAPGASLQTVNLDIGVGQFGNVALDGLGNVLPFDNASLAVTVVPEPGTALLMGLGLAGLATQRRR